MRSLTWVSEKQLTGWACSATDSPRPSFRDMIVLHTSPARPSIPTASLPVPRGLVMRGFKPKDAAEIAASEIMFENHDDPDIARKVRIEVNDFLRRLKEGFIGSDDVLRHHMIARLSNCEIGLSRNNQSERL